MVVQNGKQPLARVFTIRPLVDVGQGAGQGLLDEVVGVRICSAQGPGVAPEPWDLDSDGLSLMVHGRALGTTVSRRQHPGHYSSRMTRH